MVKSKRRGVPRPVAVAGLVTLAFWCSLQPLPINSHGVLVKRHNLLEVIWGKKTSVKRPNRGAGGAVQNLKKDLIGEYCNIIWKIPEEGGFQEINQKQDLIWEWGGVGVCLAE